MWSYNYSDELYHHGIKGQRWGIRRYQNKDGTLTPAGKKRALKMQNEYTKFSNDKRYRDKDGNLTYSGKKKALKMKETYSELTGGKQLRKFSSSNSRSGHINSKLKSKSKDKSIGEMTDDEIRSKINRIRLENELKSLTPETKSAGQKFIEGLKKQTISMITDKGTKIVGDYVDKKLRDQLGLNEKDEMAKLKKEAEKINYMRQIALGKNYLDSLKPKKTETKNLIGDINDLTDQQVKDMISRLSDEETLVTKLANHK